MKDTFTYESPTDDFVSSAHQDYRLPPGHVWFRNGAGHALFFRFFYALFFIVSWIYARLVLRVRVVGFRRFRQYMASHRTACFVYGNHTLPQGDIALTVLLNYPHKVSAILSPANFGIPVIGTILRHCDMLAVPKTKQQSMDFHSAMDHLVDSGVTIAIYPEAHVWPYYTRIRPFSGRSFKYPLRYGVPAWSSTVTYQRRKIGKKPKVTVFVDGPFFPAPNLDSEARLTPEEQRADLRDRIQRTMEMRSEASTYEYKKYRKKTNEHTL